MMHAYGKNDCSKQSLPQVLKKFIPSFLMVLFVSTSVMAQNMVTGKVSDATDGSGLPGVSIAVQGSSRGVTTDANGNYSVEANNGQTLVFSFVGYVSQSINVNASVINVKLSQDNTQLQDVVVVGYGTQKRKEVSGTVTSLGDKEFVSGVVTNPLAAAQGKVAGLVITQASGDPNSTPTVRLRGTGSLNASSSPLYVVDGVIGVPIENIAPQDIASMDVLRDASAAAIYGARAANGVIIINTKRGTTGAPRVDYSGVFGVETISRRPNLLNASQFREAAAKYNQSFDDKGANTDWLDVITRNGNSQNHNLAVSGGSDKSSYRASVGYLKQNGTLIGSSKERWNGRLNFDSKSMDDKLITSFNVSAQNTTGNFPDQRAVGFAMNMRPTDPVYNSDGSYFQIPGTFANFNPLAYLENQTSQQSKIDFLFNSSVGYKILPDLLFKVSGTLRTQTNDYAYYAKAIPGNLLNIVGNNSASRRSDNSTDKLLEVTLNYNKELADNSRLTLLGGYTFQDVVYDGFYASNNNFLTDLFGANNLGAGLGIRSNPNLIGSYKNEYKLVSFLGRATYTLNDKYFATINVRRDGSTKFGDNNKWGFFPSFSAGWNISEEDFMAGSAFDNLKLRGNWGRTGNSEGISPLLSKSFYGASGSYFDGSKGDFLPAYVIQSNPNPNLKWEVNENYGAGLDFSVNKGKLTGSIDYYTRKTKDLLYTVNVPQEEGYVYPTMLVNIGSVQNAGIEISATYQFVDSQDWSVSSTLAASFNRNKVLSLKNDQFAAPDQIFLPTSLGSFIRGTSNVNFSVLQAGYSIGEFYGAKVDRIEGGKYVFKDLNGDGSIDATAGDRTYLGNPNPLFVGSLTTNIRYKQFDLSFMLNANLGAKIMNTNNLLLGRQEGRLAESGALATALTSEVNDPTTISMDYYVESGDFLRLGNANLGYNIPLNSKAFRSARIYLAGNNLFLLTKYTGVDPEVSQNLSIGSSAPGIDVRDTYYKTRAMSVGINLSF